MKVGGPVHAFWVNEWLSRSGERPEWTEDEAIDAACEKSSFICGLWKLLDVEIPLTVVPFEHLADGDIFLFLNNLQFNLLQIVAAGMPKVSRVMLLQLDNIEHWRAARPDVLKTWMVNARRLDDEHVERTNAVQGRLRRERQRPTMEMYDRTSCLIAGAHGLTQELDAAALSGLARGSTRASQASEHQRLREIYSTQTWRDTRVGVEDWIFERFEKAAAGDAAMDRSWPVSDRIADAETMLPRHRQLTRTWCDKQRLTPRYTGTQT